MPNSKYNVHYKQKGSGHATGDEHSLYVAIWHKSEAFEIAESGNIGVYKDLQSARVDTMHYIRERLEIENKLFNEWGAGAERSIVDLQYDMAEHGYAACYLEDPMSTSFVFEIVPARTVDIS